MRNLRQIVYSLWLKLKHLVDLHSYIDVDQAADSIRANVRFRGPNVVILFCAIIIASVGLNVNSIPVIIGAMLISPLMAPIMGLGMALGTNDFALLRLSLRNLGVMVGISILASTLYFLVSPLDMEHPTELLARTNPTIYDVLIALFGGFAGILETSRKEKGTVVVGVAIATALMPPLCTVGYGIAGWNMMYALGAMYLFFINLAFITLSALVGTKYLGYKQVKEVNSATHRRSRVIMTVALIGLIVPSVLSGISVIRETNFARSANAFVTEHRLLGKSYVFDHKLHLQTEPRMVELYIAGEELSTEDSVALYTAAAAYGLTADQILLHQDAAYRDVSLNENEMVRDILHSNEEKLAARAAEIAQLVTERDSLREIINNAVLPEAQITAEIKAQYPVVETVRLASTNEKDVVVVLSVGRKGLPASERKVLESWLKIRLNVESVILVISGQ